MTTLFQGKRLFDQANIASKPSKRVSKKRASVRRMSHLSEALERRLLLSGPPISPAVQTAILDTLTAIRTNLRDAFANDAKLRTVLPVVNASINQALDLSAILTNGLYNPVLAYFAAPGADVDGLASALAGISYGSGGITVNATGVSVNVITSDPTSPQLGVDFTLNASQTTSRTALFPRNEHTAFDDSNYNIGVDSTTLSETAGLTMPVQLVMPFRTAAILPAEVHASLAGTQITAQVSTMPAATARLGMLDLSIAPSPMNFNVAITPSLAADVAGTLTLLQLQSGALGGTLTTTATQQSLDATLAVSTTFAGELAGASPALRLTSSDVFNIAPSWSLSAGLSPLGVFRNVSEADAQGFFSQLTTVLNVLGPRLNPAGDIPFISQRLSDVANVGSSFSSIADGLRSTGSGFAFRSFQALIPQLATITGLSADSFHLRVDSSTSTVLLDLNLSRHFDQPMLLDFARSLSPLSVAARAEAHFAGDVGLNLTLGFDLTNPASADSLASRLFVAAGGGFTVSADLSATGLNVAAALAGAGMEIHNGNLAAHFGTGLSFRGGSVGSSRLTLADLATGSPETHVDVTSPTVTVSGSLPIIATTPSLNTLLGINTSAPPALTLSLTTPNDLSTFHVTPDSTFTNLLSSFGNFSDTNIYQAIQRMVDFLGSTNLPLFNQRLPIINSSVNDILHLGSGIIGSAAPLQLNLTTLQTNLRTRFTAIDVIITPAVGATGLSQSQRDRLTALRNSLRSAVNSDDLSAMVTSVQAAIEGIRALIAEPAFATVAGTFTAPLASFTAILPTLDNLGTRIGDALGIPGGVTLAMIDVSSGSLAGRALTVKLDLTKTVSESLPLGFSFDGGSIPVTVSSGGTLGVSANVTAHLDFGVLLSLTSPTVFLLNTTGASVSLGAFSNSVQINATVGGIVGVDLGTATNPGRIAFKQKQSQTMTGSGSATLTLPTAITADQAAMAVVAIGSASPTTDHYTVSTTGITFDSGFAPAAGSTVRIDYPSGTNASLNFGLTDPSPDSHGVIALSELSPSIVTSPTLNAAIAASLPLKLPVIGDAGRFRFFGDLSDLPAAVAALPTEFTSALTGGSLDLSLSSIVDGIDAFLSILKLGLNGDMLRHIPLIGDTSGIRTVVDDLQSITGGLRTYIGSTSGIQTFLFDNLGPGSSSSPGGSLKLDILSLSASTAKVTSPSQIDVGRASGGDMHLNVHLVGSNTFTVPLDFHLPALSMDLTGNLNVGLGYDMQLGFGLGLREGFYFITRPDTADPEVKLQLSAALDPTTTFTGSLFFLNLKAKEGTAPEATGLDTSLTLNLNGNPSGHIGLTELRDSSLSSLVTPNLNGTATVDLDIQAGLDTTGDLPSIAGNFHLSWPFLHDSTFSSAPTVVELRNIRLKFGDYVDNLLGPMIRDFKQYIEPIRPALDFLDKPIPVITDISEFLGQPQVKVRDLIRTLGGSGFESVDRVLTALGTINSIVSTFSAADELSLDFGSYNFTQDLRNLDLPVNADTSGTRTDAPAGSPGAQMDSAAPAPTPSSPANALRVLLDSFHSIGVSFPIIEQPTRIFSLLLGQRVDIVKWDFPKLEAGFHFSERFGAILPPIPLYVRVFGDFSIFADLGMGFDTRGFESGHTVLDGLYIRDFKDGRESPEFGLDAAIGAGAELDAIVARAGVDGGLRANLHADWNDPNNDGKFYFDEIESQLSDGFDALFDLSGSMTAFLRAYATIGFDTPFGHVSIFDQSVDLVNATIFDFNTHRVPTPPQLAHVSDGTDGFAVGTLVTHIGPYASLRAAGATDGDDDITINHNSDGEVVVRGFGQVQRYSGFTSIYINAGNGINQITIDASITTNATIIAGDGNDILQGGGGHNSISGGNGDDRITGGPLSDTLDGGGGNDVIFGRAGDDLIIGGDGNDELHGDAGNDSLWGGTGNDILYGDGQPNTSGTLDPSISPGLNALYGGDGNDQLYGGNGNDSLDGGGSDDLVKGYGGDDSITGGAGDDIIYGGLGNDTIYGGDGNDSIYADLNGLESDSLLTTGGNDRIFGGAGFDYIDAGPGNDFVNGGTESDAILGGPGDDTLLGGWGDDIVRGNDGTDYIEGGSGNDDLCGQDGDDTIYGGTTFAYYDQLGPDNPTPPPFGGFSELNCSSTIWFTIPPLLPTGTGEIGGRLYWDLDGDGVLDPGEPGVNGQPVTLHDAPGNIVHVAITSDVDLNGDGVIDPQTETGVYLFGNGKNGKGGQNINNAQTMGSGLGDSKYTVTFALPVGSVSTQPPAPAGQSEVSYTVDLSDGLPHRNLDFGSYLPASITGQKFDDINGDGIRQGGEPVLNGWTIQLFDVHNNLVDSAVTHAEGELFGIYRFQNLAPGNYTLVEVPQSGYASSVSPAPLTLSSGQDAFEQDFGNRPASIIQGIKWIDANGNGMRDAGEVGLAGVRIYLDLNNNGGFDAGEPFTRTVADDPSTPTDDETGMYWLTDITPGTYTVREEVPAGYDKTYPTGVDEYGQPAGHGVNLYDGDVLTGLDFGNTPRPASISGIVYDDRDRSGIFNFDAGDMPLNGWLVFLDTNNNGVYDKTEPSQTTSQGSYVFDNLSAGDYTVRVLPFTGWGGINPAGGVQDLSLAPGDNLTANFGNRPGVITGTAGDNIFFLRLVNGTLEVYPAGDPSGQPLWSLPLADLDILTINTGGGNDTVMLDFSQGSPVPADCVDFNGGDGWDTLRLLGTAAADSTTVNSTRGIFGTSQIRYQQIEALAFDSKGGGDHLIVDDAMPFTPDFNPGGDAASFNLLQGSYRTLADLSDAGPINLALHNSTNFSFQASQNLASLTMDGTSHAIAKSGAGVNLLAGQIAISAGGTLDLFDNTLILRKAGALPGDLLAAAAALTNRAYAGSGGHWTGPGLTSTLAAADPNLGMAVFINDWGDGNTMVTSSNGQALSATDVLARTALYGDTDFSGSVDSDDYFRIDKGFLTGKKGWNWGDFNSDGIVNADDYFVIDRQFMARLAHGTMAKSEIHLSASDNTGKIAGNKWVDTDLDGKRNASEAALSGVRVYVDANGNGRYDDGEPSDITNVDGNYMIMGIATGTWTVREVVPAGYIQTTPPDGQGQEVIVPAGGMATGVNFGDINGIILPDGNDRIRGGDGNDAIFGDNGDGFPATIMPTGGNDTLWGNAGDDVIHGQQGNDLIYGGAGNDTFAGDAGNDQLFLDGGDDQAAGGDGNDTYVVSDQAMPVMTSVNESAGGGNDTFDLSAITTPVSFDLNQQTGLRLTNVAITMKDGVGGDGSPFFENILGSRTATNTLIGNAANNLLVGGTKDDLIDGGGSINTLQGGAGDDHLIVSGSANRIFGDDGTDTIDYSAFPTATSVNLQTRDGTALLQFESIERFKGTSMADTLTGQDVDSTWLLTGANRGTINVALTFENFENLTGGTANDTFHFDDASTIGLMDGQGGINTLDYSLATSNVSVDLFAGNASNTSAITRIQNAIGGLGNDTLRGNDNDNRLVGNGGDDLLVGRGGNDTLEGGAGNNQLDGGSGDDVYVMSDTPGIDTIAAAGGNDTVNYSAFTTSVVVNLHLGEATRLSIGSIASIENFAGGGGTDTLIGYNAVNTWDITGTGSGAFNTTGFTAFEKLIGGGNADHFNIHDGGTIAWLDGGGGSDTLTYALFYSTPVTVDLRTATATGVGGFSAIADFQGHIGGGYDRIYGYAADNTWNITTVSGGDISSAGKPTSHFAYFEDMFGGSGDDTFIIYPSGVVVGTLSGGTGNDTLDFHLFTFAIYINLRVGNATNVTAFDNIESFIGGTAGDTLTGPDTANTWTVLNANTGTLNSTIHFTSIERLAGGAGNDSFNIKPGASLSEGIGGGGGFNTLDYSEGATGVLVNLLTKSATDVPSVTNIQTVYGSSADDILIGDSAANRLYGLGGGDLLIGGTGNDSIVGGTGDDIVIGGYTTHDASIVELTNILGRWQAPVYADRIADLQTNLPVLLPGSTGTVFKVADDADTLDGGSGMDWFFINPGIDTYSGADPVERIDAIP